MKTNEIRKKFLAYFAKHGHKVVTSSAIVPINDKSLLFTNAGMVQFKQYFLGSAPLEYPTATSSQCCIRAGGKHNDLDNVGYTKRHHTFFEMLGNFSFGDYFKQQAIEFAWTFIVDELQIPKDKLWVTVYKDDQETADIWLQQIKVDPKRMSYCGEKDNFWSMGETGPCGPCTEIFYDHGENIPGGPPGSEDEDGDRYVEIWNLVFMEFEKFADGQLKPLPMQSVDTGMGLERIAAVMQQVTDNYEIDIFSNIIAGIKQTLPITNDNQVALKVIADHLRSMIFLLAENVYPSNEGRGYVLRRIIRRASRYGYKLGLQGEFLYKLVNIVVVEMVDQYPELKSKIEQIANAIKDEEVQFGRTIQLGLKIITKDLQELSTNTIPGELVFKMHDTYGFPIDVLQDIAKEQNLLVDHDGFKVCMERQKSLSRSAKQFSTDSSAVAVDDLLHSEFTGYQHNQGNSEIITILQDNQQLVECADNKLLGLVLSATPFYAESGGQIGDSGTIIGENFKFIVQDTQKIKNAIVHYGTLAEGIVKLGDVATAIIDYQKRLAIKNNHTGTHLLHAALKLVLGNHAEQKGSVVRDDKLRFDFVHQNPLTTQELQAVETLVNDQIRLNTRLLVAEESYEQAIANGVVALFGEKYQEKVRVINIGDFSQELCGGTHVKSTGDIGAFKIINEYSIATGIRRIEAITGGAVVELLQQQTQTLDQLSASLQVPAVELLTKVEQVLSENKGLKKELASLDSLKSTAIKSKLLTQVQNIDGANILVSKIDDLSGKVLKELVDDVLNQYPGMVVIVSVVGNKMFAISKVSTNYLKRFPKPVELIKLICGSGGGRDDMAQGGGSVPDDLDDKLQQVLNHVISIK